MAGTLVLCGTPLGNLGDASQRLREVLAEADVVYAEDTRRSRALFTALQIQARPRSYFSGNEAERARELGSHLRNGKTVALITDAGMPAISDPGLSAVRVAAEEGAAVTVVPGPSAVTAALAVSGLPSERFVFEGFLPRSGKKRRLALRALAEEPRTTVLFSAVSRLVEDLDDLASACGPERPVVVTRELTKVHEQIWRGTLGDAVEAFADTDRGEVTLVVGGAPEPKPDMEAAVTDVQRLVSEGESFSRAVRAAAEKHAVSRRSLYEEAADR